MNDLIKWNNARQALAECKTIDEVKKIKDKAEAMRAYAKQVGEALGCQNDLAEIKLRAERRAGEMLAEMDDAKAGPKIMSSDTTQLIVVPTLKELDISRDESSHWQAIARIPETIFDQIIEETKQAEKELTESMMLKVEMEIKREAAKKENEKKRKSIGQPNGLFDVIVIDPPWPIVKIERECRPNQTKELDYPIMSIDEIKKLSIPMQDDCHVFLWTTHKYLPISFEVLTEWGLKYCCTFVWHKPGGFQPVRLPQFNCEFILYARRGSPPFSTTKDFKICFEAPRGKHSEKPEVFYDIVKEHTENQQRLDMFNRREISGFERWGNEV